MKRRVLIIGSPLEGNNFLSGVNNDVRNVYRYVTSSIGGGYFDSEIHYLYNPQKSRLLHALRLMGGSEIAVVYFSGHGFRYQERDFIWLNSYEQFPVHSLVTASHRNIIITDACRTPRETFFYGDIISGTIHFSTDHIALARNLYWQYLLNSPKGNAFVFSTSDGMPSEDTESGGLFTKSLITELRKWSDTEYQKTITLRQIFTRACYATRNESIFQIPSVKYQRGNNVIDLPFAINPVAHIYAGRKARTIEQFPHLPFLA